MQAVILAGGLGSRLRPYTMHIPKPLLPLGDKPVIEIVVRQLAASGIDDVIITTGFLAHLVEAYVGNGEQFGTNVRYVREESPLGTAGPLREVSDLEEHFLVLNGDLLTTFNFGGLLDDHARSGADLTVAATRRTVHIDYGVVVTNTAGDLERYDEKPTLDYHVSMGIYGVSLSALKHMPPTGRFDMPELVRAIVAAGGRVCTAKTDVYWQDIGRFDDYQTASADFVTTPDRFLRGA